MCIYIYILDIHICIMCIYIYTHTIYIYTHAHTLYHIGPDAGRQQRRPGVPEGRLGGTADKTDDNDIYIYIYIYR